MLKKFVKMQGAGNDYIYFDCFEGEPEDIPALAVRLSDRHKGIGGDGLVLICRSDVADAKMRMFNADGSEGNMCGNAIRCVGKYLYDENVCRKEALSVETKSGINYLRLYIEHGKVKRVRVDMGKADFDPKSLPVLLEGEAVDRPVKIAGGLHRITCVSMGNPHCVLFEDPDGADLERIGPLSENAPLFPERVNTEFVKVIGKNALKMRVWERGNGETLACGTGAAASVVAAVLAGYCRYDEDITVKVRGGDLIVRYSSDGRVTLTGNVKQVFEGTVEF